MLAATTFGVTSSFLQISRPPTFLAQLRLVCQEVIVCHELRGRGLVSASTVLSEVRYTMRNGCLWSLVGSTRSKRYYEIVDCRSVKDEMTATGLSAKAHGF